MSDLAQALMVAIKVHAKQVDKQGEPYLLHILRVVGAVDDEAKVVAALHDALEDREGYWELGEIYQMINPDKFQLEALELLTRSLYKEETYSRYIENIAKAPDISGVIARKVKIVDLRDNLGRIPPEPDDSRELEYNKWKKEWFSLKKRYEKAIQVLES